MRRSSMWFGLCALLLAGTPGIAVETEFPFERYTTWVEGNGTVHLIERRAVPPFGHFSLIRFGKNVGAGRVSVPRSAAG